MAKKKSSPLFSIHPDDLQRQTNIHQELIDNSLFILPHNDGEAARACQILEAVKAPHVHISKQSWGATLDQEWPQLDLSNLKAKGIKRFVIFEIPGKAALMGDPIEKEELITKEGFELTIIDHHHYKWVERYKPVSSLEQLCQLIGWEMNEIDMAIAVNDRSYIPGLKSLGLSIDDIRKIRLFDLENQGNSRSYIDKQIQISRSLIPELESKRLGELWILDQAEYKQPYIVQELSIQSTIGLIHAFEIKPHKLGFSGDPDVVNQLMSRDYTHWEKQTGTLINYGGGDGKTSKFWGLKTSENRKTIPEEMAKETLEFIKQCRPW